MKASNCKEHSPGSLSFSLNSDLGLENNIVFINLLANSSFLAVN